MGHTQRGNNNAYCQDNEITWLDWTLDEASQDYLRFVRYLIRLRQTHPVLARRRFFQGRSIRGQGIKDISWFGPNGKEMDDTAWHQPFVRCLGVRLEGTELDEIDEFGSPLTGDTLYLVFNANVDAVRFRLAAVEKNQYWERLLDTSLEKWDEPRQFKHGYKMARRSLVIFRLATK